MKKIIVFGATGNIGAYIVDYINQNINHNEYEVIAVGRKSTSFFDEKEIQYIKVDICNENDFKKLPTEDIYSVINVAGILPAYLKDYNPFLYTETNVIGALRILEYARKNKADRVLYTQTWAVQAGYWGTQNELSPYMPKKLIYTGDHAFYSITKSMVEDTIVHYNQEYGLKSFVFRLPNIYMYHPNNYYYVDCKLKPVGYRYLIDRAQKGETIEMWGNPDAYKDIIYIKDLCQMMYKAIFADVNFGIYNAGTGIKTTLREQIQGIVDVFTNNEKRSKIIEKPDGDTFTSFVMDISNAKIELGYEPEFTYLKYLEDYKKEQELKRFDSLWIG